MQPFLLPFDLARRATCFCALQVRTRRVRKANSRPNSCWAGPERNPKVYGAKPDNGGERGIRTLDTVSRIHAFQACALNHSATSPQPVRITRSPSCRRRGCGLLRGENTRLSASAQRQEEPGRPTRKSRNILSARASSSVDPSPLALFNRPDRRDLPFGRFSRRPAARFAHEALRSR